MRVAEDRLALCISERDEMRFKMENEQQRLEKQLRAQDGKFNQMANDVRYVEASGCMKQAGQC